MYPDTFIRKEALTHMKWVEDTLWFLPWVLVVIATVFLSLGLSWRHITDADTVNGAFLIVALVLGALAICTLCVREMPELHEEKRRGKAPAAKHSCSPPCGSADAR